MQKTEQQIKPVLNIVEILGTFVPGQFDWFEITLRGKTLKDWEILYWLTWTISFHSDASHEIPDIEAGCLS